MTASQHYSPQQISAWAQIDESRWKEKLAKSGNDSNLLIVFYVQIMPDDLVMQLHRF